MGTTRDTDMHTDLETLNKREPQPVLILRLIAEAQARQPVSVSLPDMLEFKRDQYSLTKAEWASVLGLGVSHYSEVLRGKRGLPLSATKRAFAIGVPADVLLQL